MVLSEDNHIQTINSYTTQDWQPLFDLIPQFESIPKFGHSGPVEIDDEGVVHIPHVREDPIIGVFRQLVYEIPIIVDFDWASWDEGRRMVNDDTFDFDSIDIPTKCKLITAFVRNDRFCDGALAAAFDSGLILKILKSIQNQL